MSAHPYTTADELLELLRKVHNEATSQQLQQTFASFLSRLFELPERRGSEYIAFSKFSDLCIRLLNEVESLQLPEHRKARNLEDADRIVTNLMNMGPNFPLTSWRGNFSTDSLRTLTSLSDVLAGRIDYLDVQDDVDNLRGELLAVQENILASSLPSDLKGALLKRIDELLVALRNIRVWGYDSVRDLAVLLGTELTMAAKSELPPEDRGLLKRAGPVAVSVLALIENAAKHSRNLDTLALKFQALLGALPS